MNGHLHITTLEIPAAGTSPKVHYDCGICEPNCQSTQAKHEQQWHLSICKSSLQDTSPLSNPRGPTGAARRIVRPSTSNKLLCGSIISPPLSREAVDLTITLESSLALSKEAASSTIGSQK